MKDDEAYMHKARLTILEIQFVRGQGGMKVIKAVELLFVLELSHSH
jgi:hypothetical protein